MLIDFRVVAACCAIVVGVLVIWANSSRPLNRVFFLFSVFVGAWLFCQWRASESGVWWVRMAFAAGALVVLMMWLVKQTAAMPERTTAQHLRTMVPWLVVCALLIWVCFTDSFIPPTSTNEKRLHGWGFYAYLGTLGLMVIGIGVQSVVQMRRLSGVRRLELQMLLLGSAAAGLAVVILVALGAATGNPAFNRAQSIFVLAFYVGTSWSIATTRVLDARYVLAIGLSKLATIVLTAVAGLVVFRGVSQFGPDWVALLFAVGAGLGFAGMIEPMASRMFRLYRSDAESRTSAYDVSRRETRPEQLELAFRKVLQSWAKSEHAVIMIGGPAGFTGSGLTLSNESDALAALRQLRWATPERLSRERPSNDREVLRQFLEEQRLGLVAITEGPAMSALVGVGIPASNRPFTYVQVTQLIELASIVENALERAHFAVKVQHTEQLATVGLLGASLAHEIRNPLVSIKTFVQLLPTHHHDPAFREKFFRLIGDEVGRIDQLTEQLLDLASPRTYTAQVVELHPILRASVDLVAAKAAHRSVQVVTDFQASPDRAFTDASAAKQVMLNLCFNAIQAVEHKDSDDRWVRIATRNTSTGIEMAVADNGPGIAEEIRSRLFQPFQTTKSTGFGLGLAICSDILANLNASISVDPPAPGAGATFRVTFPCQPLSS